MHTNVTPITNPVPFVMPMYADIIDRKDHPVKPPKAAKKAPAKKAPAKKAPAKKKK